MWVVYELNSQELPQQLQPKAHRLQTRGQKIVTMSCQQWKVAVCACCQMIFIWQPDFEWNGDCCASLFLKAWTDLWQDVGISEEASCGYCWDKSQPCGADCRGIDEPSVGAFLSTCCCVSRIVYFPREQHGLLFFKHLWVRIRGWKSRECLPNRALEGKIREPKLCCVISLLPMCQCFFSCSFCTQQCPCN